MHKTVLVTGAAGQLGQSIQKLASQFTEFDFTYIDHAELDLTSESAINRYFAQHAFDVIINCAAYTAVDKAESEQTIANQVNHLAVAQLAKIAKQTHAVLLHVSTDYVFNGQNHKPYQETDQTQPQGVYGQTKLQGEQAFLKAMPKGCIVRTSWVYSEFGNNFVKTMLKLGQEREQLTVIYDQVGTPTYATDLAHAILTMLQSETLYQAPLAQPVYHFSDEGVCSWYDFAKTIFELSAVSCTVLPIETKDYPTPAKRPHYSVLNKAKIKQDFTLSIPYWKDALKACLATLQGQN